MMIARITAAIAALALAGCESWPKIDDTGFATPVAVTSSDYCSIARKITWQHPGDTPATIDQVRRHNASHDKRCGVPKSASTASAPTSSQRGATAQPLRRSRNGAARWSMR